MNKLHASLAVVFAALSATAFAQSDESDAARQQRMDAAYADSHHEGVSGAVRDDTHEAGHAIHNGVRATGHAVHSGVRATGHAIHRGVRATGHAIHEGTDKITGK